MSVYKIIIAQELCIGCGVCTLGYKQHQVGMQWNKYGFLVPEVTEKMNFPDENLNVCPFNPFPEKEVHTEDKIGDLFLGDAPKNKDKIGHYYDIYAGYSQKYRFNSSSGGIATYILTQLIKQGIVDHVVSVRSSSDTDSHYEYQISSTPEEVVSSSKTKYYPVTLATALDRIKAVDGRIAVTGVACFVKGLRLLQHYDSYWKDKIAFIVGIICGGVKSAFYADYLASKAGVTGKYDRPQFRIKDFESKALDYSYGCVNDKGIQHQIKMRTVGDMWGTGLFKNNACDFCDDVTTELADISLGDAWIPPYDQDGKGTNVIVTRSALADRLIKDGIKKEELSLVILPEEKFLSSQQGSFNHRHKGLKYRIKQTSRKGYVIPPKRYADENTGISFRFVQQQRLIVRKESLNNWLKSGNATDFDMLMYKPLQRLKRITRINHYVRAFKRKMKKLFN
jgi:coenzyme F420-reducing hydrogenase beta subunit